MISTERMNGHFLKIHLGDGTVLHLFSAADGPDADFHDHAQWGFWSTILEGGYREEVLNPETGEMQIITRNQGDRFRVEHDHTHRIIELLAPMTITFVEPDQHRGVRENWFQRNIAGWWKRNGESEWWELYKAS